MKRTKLTIYWFKSRWEMPVYVIWYLRNKFKNNNNMVFALPSDYLTCNVKRLKL